VFENGRAAIRDGWRQRTRSAQRSERNCRNLCKV